MKHILKQIKSFVRNVRYILFGWILLRRKAAGISEPYYIRFWSSDAKCEKQVLSENEWSPNDFGTSVCWIIDAGANIGLRSIQFANFFPEATIIAIEPDDGNFKLLQKNAAPYKNIHCLQAGLWKSDAILQIVNPKSQSWSFIVSEVPSLSTHHNIDTKSYIRGITVPTLMKEYSIETLDILKMDIEGSEKDVFEYSDEWFYKVNCFFIEFHERYKPGAKEVFYKRINIGGYQIIDNRDENVLAKKV
jgi:FkbM family methyltransferase